MSKSSSRLIAQFQSIRQQMQLKADQKAFVPQDIEKVKTRHQKIYDKDKKQAKKQSKLIQAAQNYKKMDDHRITLEQFSVKYQTNLKLGLTQEEANRRLEVEGPNRLTQRQGVHWTIKLFKQMTTPFALLLWLGGALCFVAYGISTVDPSNLYLGVALFIIVILTSLMTFYQNMKSQAIMDSFKDFIPPQTIVIREGVQKTIDATLLVRGDLIKIQLGKKIPADIRIIDSQGMKVDNSSLTGQTELLSRSVQCTNKENPLQTKNIAFFSTLNKQGSGKGIVMFTGDNTFIGQIANMASVAIGEQSPLSKQMGRFILRITIFASVCGVVLFCLGFAIGYPAITNFIFGIGIIVANVPEGLIAEVTVGLTLTAKRLSQKKVLVKNLEAVETLGSTTCICSDKTGTLTQNKMTACHLWYNGRSYKADNFQKNGNNFNYEYNYRQAGFRSLHQCAVVCSVANFDTSVPAQKVNAINNNKTFNQNQKKQKISELKLNWEQNLKNVLWLDMPTTGDASQSALIKFFRPFQDITKLRQQFSVCIDKQGKQCRIPFNSTNKYAYSINSYQTDQSNYCVFTKGAPQKIWKLCTHVLQNGLPVLKTSQWDKKFEAINHAYGKGGQRVLGFAKLHLPKNQYPQGFNFNAQNPNFPFKQQCFVGMLSLTDPPRDTVPFAVQKCQAAGIKVIMVTGDQPVTATAIAKLCHIIREKTVNQIAQENGLSFQQAFNMSNAIVIHGDQITKMNLEDEGLPQSEQGKPLQKWLSKSQIVFARTSPAQKLVIVKGCQKAGHIVAVTGDGVNDSPAIKKADIGIAMGITGTDVAKDAADMVLLNDDFSSIVVGVEQGRRIFDNLKKATCYALSSQIAQIMPYVGFLIFQYPLPCNTVILLYIDLGTDMIPAIAYAYEQAQLDLMTRKPRSKQDHLVTMKLMYQSYGYIGWLQFWGAFFAFYTVIFDFGFKPGELNGKATINVFSQNPQDRYNPADPYFGNSVLSQNQNSCNSKTSQMDWIYTTNAYDDLRMTALNCKINPTTNLAEYSQMFNWGDCRVHQISPFTNLPICYTSQAIKYGQSAYFYGVVVCQIFTCLLAKTRKLSLAYQGMNNYFQLFGICTEICLVIICAYFQPFNIAFGTRDTIFMHFGIPALAFAMFQLTLDEIKKYLIRNLPKDQKGKPNWFQRMTLW